MPPRLHPLLTIPLLLAGCHAPPPAPGPGSGPGSVSYVVQSPPPAPETAPDRLPDETTTLPTGEEYFLPARPRGILASALYPTRAAATSPATVILSVRLAISATGAVTGVELNPLAYSTPLHRPDEFLAALRAVSTRWEFVPAAHLGTEDPSDAGGPRRLRKRPVASELEVQFTFLRPSAH